MDSVSLLRELCDAIGVSGYEEQVREVIEAKVLGLVDELRTDALGNLIALRRASRPEAPTLMLDAHMDEIGLVVSYVEPSGFLRFATVGGWDERVLPGHAVTVCTRAGRHVRGVIGVAPPHIQREEERKKPYSVEALFIDIGASSREEVQGMGVSIGDSAVPFYPFTELAGDVVMGKALDDRAGCAVLVCALEELAQGEPLEVNLAAVFSTFEEVGARGAQAAAFAVDPQVALVLEGTVAADVPGVPEARRPSAQGLGPALTIMDRSLHCSPKLVRKLEDLARSEGIPFQYKTPIFGGTDGSRIHTSRAGVLTGVVSVPCRYIHSPHATLRMQDFENTVRLVTSFVRQCGELLASK